MEEQGAWRSRQRVRALEGFHHSPDSTLSLHSDWNHVSGSTSTVVSVTI